MSSFGNIESYWALLYFHYGVKRLRVNINHMRKKKSTVSDPNDDHRDTRVQLAPELERIADEYAAFQKQAYSPSLLTSSRCIPCSISFPSFRTKISSAFITVPSLWAIRIPGSPLGRTRC